MENLHQSAGFFVCCLRTFVNNKNNVFHGNANTKLCIISVGIARRFKSKQQFSYKKATKNSRYSEYTESFVIAHMRVYPNR